MSVLRCVFLFSLFVEYLHGFTNWWLKFVAICFGVVFVLWLKVIDLFDCVVVFFAVSLLIVFHSMCVFVLWSHDFASLSFRSFVLFVWMRLVISVFMVFRSWCLEF